jgi:hypothetical protein
MKRFVSMFCLFLLAAPAMAAGRLADVEIHDRVAGRWLPIYESGGHWYIAGRPGNEYQVVIRNRVRGDVLAVVSVDGVNVVSGETAASAQSGYVIGNGKSLSIAGWRKSMDKIAAFYFTDLGDSYAARTGRPDNVGVIGVALFRRKPPEPLAELEQPRARAEADASNGSAARRDAAPVQEKKIGTGHGRSQEAPAQYVEFERESDAPAEVIAIHYDTYANLVARGVIQEERRLPSPFPGGFVPDPPQRG